MDSNPAFTEPTAAEHFVVPGEAHGRRLDHFLAAMLPDDSRSRLQSLIRQGHVLLNGEKARPSEPVRPGDKVDLFRPAATPCPTAAPEDIALDILQEDDAIIVINKPAGLVVHPGAGNLNGTLVSALLHHCDHLSGIGGVERPGIVHRLDKETSGCMVVAKTDAAHRSLSAQFADRTVQKTYLALVAGCPKQPAGIIDAPITRHPVHRQKMAVRERGRPAVTEYRVLAKTSTTSLVECHPRTGRTHQVRVHLRHLGCPILGDPLYGKRGDYSRHYLHAWKLEFQHPTTGKTLIFEAPPPPEFTLSSR